MPTSLLLRYRRFLLSFVSIAIIAFASSSSKINMRVSGQSRSPSCTGCATQSEQAIYIPLTYLPEEKSGQIVFNSRSAHAMDVTPVFYFLDGTIVHADPVSINPTEIRYVDLSTLIPAEYHDRKDWGGLSLKYYGGNREMWAQFRFLGVNGGNNVDEFFVVEQEQRSDLKAATWWAPAGSKSVIALGNITDDYAGATVQFGDGQVEQVDLAPHASRTIRHSRLTTSGTTESVSISLNGAPGSIVPTGLIETSNSNSNSVIRFYDPRLTKQANLYGNGLTLKKMIPHMILNNTSADPIIVNPKFMPEAGGSANPVALAPVLLDAYRSVEVDLTELMNSVRNRKDLDVVSVEVDSSGSAGDLIGALYTSETSTGFTYDVPLRDSGPVRTMTGSYPWKVDDDYSTVVYITNITDIKQEFVGQVNFPGGKLVLKTRTLSPGETAEIDLRKLRDEQKTDDLNNKIPLGVTQGQFRWAIHGATGGKLALIGRAVMKSKSNRIMTSYSCNDPCPPSYGGDLSPFGVVVVVNASGSMMAWETAYYDNGYEPTMIGPYEVSVDWSMDTPEYSSMAAQADGSEMFTGASPGTNEATAYFGTFEHFTWDGLECLDDYQFDLTDSAPVEVTPRVIMTAFSVVGKGSVALVSVDVFGTTDFGVTLRLRKLSGTGLADFLDNESDTLPISGSGTYTVRGITESDSVNNYIIEALYNNQVLASNTFSISAAKIFRTVGTQQATEITDTTISTIVGERFRLSAEIVPSGLSLSTQAWAIPGTKVKEFFVDPAGRNPTVGHSNPVAGLDTASVNFIWVDGNASGQNRQVTYTATILGYPVQGKANFNVQKVTTNFTSIAGVTGTTPNFPLAPYTGMVLYPRNGTTHGIEMTRASTTIPSPYTGHFQFVQIANHVTVTQITTTGTQLPVTNLHGLDECYPYILNEVNSYDTPGVALENASTVIGTSTFDANFDTYLMFKPDTTESDWVPLKVIDWTWVGEADFITTSNPHAWTPVQHSNPGDANGNSTGFDTTDYPTWSQLTRQTVCVG